ncbi:energy transducer TonB [Roseomonas sp. NAR14]|uniref:Energy transducer TonB n=1 Tax=Roseomonas acroporae TaxID=2937791 RepID=A0A9X1Y6T6_9PROT|nr:energy transducer TonB [Roseomonas acroporae]MCK8784566.1 energy transducer TonB [Roseomonas acroporae]
MLGDGRGRGDAAGRNGAAYAMAEGATVAPRLSDSTCQAIQYPAESQERGEAGTVSLRLRVADDGHVVAATVTASSGFPALDEAASRAARRCRFVPGLREGRPVFSTVTWSVTFRDPVPRRR